MSETAMEKLRSDAQLLRDFGERLRNLVQERPDGWQKQYVQLRRDMQVQLGKVRDQAEECFKGGFASDYASDFRAAFNRFRTALALHQANWSIVAIAPNDAEYNASINNVIHTHNLFDAIVMRMLIA